MDGMHISWVGLIVLVGLLVTLVVAVISGAVALRHHGGIIAAVLAPLLGVAMLGGIALFLLRGEVRDAERLRADAVAKTAEIRAEVRRHAAAARARARDAVPNIAISVPGPDDDNQDNTCEVLIVDADDPAAAIPAPGVIGGPARADRIARNLIAPTVIHTQSRARPPVRGIRKVAATIGVVVVAFVLLRSTVRAR